MSYTDLTTVNNIQGYLSGIVFSVNTIPTLANVEKWIDEATAIIYGRLTLIYDISTSITDTDSLLILENIANLYVLANISFAKDKQRTGVSAGLMQPQRAPKYDVFNAELERLCTRELILPNVASSSITKSNSYAVANNISFVSNKDEAIW